jgi:hypothetical protein
LKSSILRKNHLFLEKYVYTGDLILLPEKRYKVAPLKFIPDVTGS